MFKTRFLPTDCPKTAQLMKVGQFSYKIILNTHANRDGLCQLYLQCFSNNSRIRIPLGIRIAPKSWDPVKQAVRGKSQFEDDVNLLIQEAKARAHEVVLRFRLRNFTPTLEQFKEDFFEPDSTIDFIIYFEKNLELRKGGLEYATYKSNRAVLNKLRAFSPTLPFSSINKVWLDQFKGYCRTKLKNSPSTIHKALQTIKIYLNLAVNQDGLKPGLNPDQIKFNSHYGHRGFLTLGELQLLTDYYNSKFCPDSHRNTLQPFLFSCYTGLRYSDLAAIKRTDIVNGQIIIKPYKTKNTGKMICVRLTEKAKQFMNDDGPLFTHVYPNQTGNRYLKEIMRMTKIKKTLTWHVSRHTFATTFLTLGGSVDVLQDLMGHSTITQTMIYAHMIDERKDKQMALFDLI